MAPEATFQDKILVKVCQSFFHPKVQQNNFSHRSNGCADFVQAALPPRKSPYLTPWSERSWRQSPCGSKFLKPSRGYAPLSSPCGSLRSALLILRSFVRPLQGRNIRYALPRDSLTLIPKLSMLRLFQSRCAGFVFLFLLPCGYAALAPLRACEPSCLSCSSCLSCLSCFRLALRFRSTPSGS